MQYHTALSAKLLILTTKEKIKNILQSY